ncbi:SDR family NAD(P)-dependent oxidoreductase [Novosphingobium panipatense]
MRSPIDQVAVITGASSGIGKAAAIELLREGWHVIATGRDPDRCAAAEKELRALPGARVDFVRGDFAEMADVRRVAREIASLTARVHVLVNNAGVFAMGCTRPRRASRPRLPPTILPRSC